jgi:mevalonate kinase
MILPSFPAKILLFGEYSVLAGSDACAFPFNEFSGRLGLADSDKEGERSWTVSHRSLNRLYGYLSKPGIQEEASVFLDLGRLHEDLDAGLFFDSNIPQNYGVGSSGALVAAVYQAYKLAFADPALNILRAHLALIESAFHTKSSGMDPLVSYLGRPVFIVDRVLSTPDLNLDQLSGKFSIGLIDSGMPGTTRAGVGTFISENFIQGKEKNIFESDYIPLINLIVNELITSDPTTNGPENLFDHILRLSEFQLRLFPSLFTPEMASLTQQGITSGEFAIKLCGSGGGGFFLRIVKA